MKERKNVRGLRTKGHGAADEWAPVLDKLGHGIEKAEAHGALTAGALELGDRVWPTGMLDYDREWVAVLDALPISAVAWSYRTPIAVRVGVHWFIPNVKWSRTTTMHQSTIQGATRGIVVDSPADLRRLAAGMADPITETAHVLIRDGMGAAEALAAAERLLAV